MSKNASLSVTALCCRPLYSDTPPGSCVRPRSCHTPHFPLHLFCTDLPALCGSSGQGAHEPHLPRPTGVPPVSAPLVCQWHSLPASPNSFALGPSNTHSSFPVCFDRSPVSCGFLPLTLGVPPRSVLSEGPLCTWDAPAESRGFQCRLCSGDVRMSLPSTPPLSTP